MPNCWYVLMRFFLRVDSTLVRMRETRLFCDMRQPDGLVREVKHAEAALAELSGNAASGKGVRMHSPLPVLSSPSMLSSSELLCK